MGTHTPRTHVSVLLHGSKQSALLKYVFWSLWSNVVSVIPGGAILGNRLASFALLEAAGSWIANWFPLQYVIDMMSRGSAAKFVEELIGVFTRELSDLVGGSTRHTGVIGVPCKYPWFKIFTKSSHLGNLTFVSTIFQCALRFTGVFLGWGVVQKLVVGGAEHPLVVHASLEPNPHLEGSVSVHGTHCLVVGSQLYGVGGTEHPLFIHASGEGKHLEGSVSVHGTHCFVSLSQLYRVGGAEHPFLVHASKEPNPHLEGSVSVHGTHVLVVESQLYRDPGPELGLRVSTYQTTTAIATTRSRSPAPSIILWAVVSIFFVLRK